MLPRPGKWLGVPAFLFLLFACTPIPPVPELPTGAPGAALVLADTDAIPLDWGTLVAVTDAQGDTYSRLWFQDGSGTIRMAAYDRQERKLWSQAYVILRR